MNGKESGKRAVNELWWPTGKPAIRPNGGGKLIVA
jgi:hypothetical protein